MQEAVQSFPHNSICCNTSRSRLKHQILLSVQGSKLLQPGTGGENDLTLSCTPLPINMKEELRGVWLINRKLPSILINYGIIDLPLFWIEGCRIGTYSHDLVDW